jgi:hypothetical protein
MNMTKAPQRPIKVRPNKTARSNRISAKATCQLKRTMLPRSLDILFALRYRR